MTTIDQIAPPAGMLEAAAGALHGAGYVEPYATKVATIAVTAAMAWLGATLRELGRDGE